jgi:hypothetical protein
VAGARQRVLEKQTDGRLVVDVKDRGHCGAESADRSAIAIGYHIDARRLPPERRYWLSDACIPAAATSRGLSWHRDGARENGLGS